MMSKFKVGDRVRTKGYEGTQWDGEGVVTKEYDGFCLIVSINGSDGVFAPSELEPVTLQLEAGKYYRTRDGRKVGPMHHEGWLDGEPWTSVNSERYYTDSGGRIEPKSYLADLVAEWVDEPVAGPASNAAAQVDNLREEYGPISAPSATNDNTPKIKVGDRVRYSDYVVDGFGTVRMVGEHGGYYVTVEEADRGYAFFFDDTARVFVEEDLTLVAEPPSAPAPDDATYGLTALGDAYVAGYQAGLAAATARAA